MPFINTQEQNLIINDNSYFLAIRAFAGTGKTTTLKEFALKNKDKKILYVAYNKETASQARKSFPSNVIGKNSTQYSLCKIWKTIGKKIK